MASFRITRTHEIDAGHRVCGHEGKCAHLHGHRYKFHFTCEAVDDELDAIGRVVDFSVIKERLCQWLDDHWDHRLLLSGDDPWMPLLRTIDPAVVSVPFNPTAEELARYLVAYVGEMQLAGTGVRLVSCTVEETAKCSASYGE